MNDLANLAQLEKRIDFLDNERRNDKTALAAMQSKIDNLTTENSSLRMRLSDLESEISRINTIMARVDQFDVEIANLRTEFSRQIDEIKSSSIEKSLQAEKHSQRIEDLNLDLIDVRKKIAEFEQLPGQIEERKVEDSRLARSIEELKVRVNEINRFDEEYKRSVKMLEENIRQENKRVTDLQGEISALRKRLDESRGKQDLVSDGMRKLDIRIKELVDAESERKEAQIAFIEKINVAQVERDRTFRSWSERFEKVETIAHDVESEITKLTETHSSARKTLSSLDEVTQRFDRRVNEITEVQRLNEDRFRQEWTTFKSDDQKRWSNYTLAQDEQHREMNRELESFGDRITNLETLIKSLQDDLDQVGRENLKRMQAQFMAVRESIEAYNKIFKS
ncbi:MAG: hypothetical protein QM230_05315 [Chloroflexota bacterium]|nr:hypothetical protein [Chloroflexota bacterium]